MTPEEKAQLIGELNSIPDAISAMSLVMTSMVSSANDLMIRLQSSQNIESEKQIPVTGSTIAQNIAAAEAKQNATNAQPQLIHEGVPFIKPMQPIPHGPAMV